MIDAAGQSGSLEHVVGIAAGLATRGHKVTLLCPVSTTPDARLGATGVVVRASAPGGSPVKGAFALRRLARRTLTQDRYDAVYLRAFPADWPIVLAGLPWTVPVAYELNTIIEHEYQSVGKPWQGQVYRRLAAVALRRADGWLPVTEEIGRWARRASGAERPQRIAPNGVALPPAVSSDERGLIREELRIAPTQAVVGMAGFVHPWHGVELALAMLSALPPRFTLWLIGSRSPADTFRAMDAAQAKGVADRVRIFPWLPHDEASRLLAACDVALGALRIEAKRLREAQEMKVAHALAVGVPVVVNHPDPRLRDGLPFARQVAPDDPAALAAAVAALAAAVTPELRAATRRYAEDHLSWDAAARHTEDFLLELIAGRSDRKP